MLIECERCDARVDGKEIGGYSVYDDNSGLAFAYTLLKCPQCTSPILVVQEDFGVGDRLEDPTRMFPSVDDLARLQLPAMIEPAHREAIACFKAKANLATVIMCRKILESMCKEHGTKARSLANGLKELKDKDVIENRLYEWSEALRIAGNEAAHEVSLDVSRQDASDILDLTEAILQYVYAFTDKFNAFMSRRSKRPGPKKGTARARGS